MLHGEEQKKKEKINPLPSNIIHLIISVPLKLGRVKY